MSLKKFKTLDICAFAVIAIIFEVLNYVASTKLEDFKLIFLSYTIVITLITIYRWGLIGSCVALIGGIAACIVAGRVDYQTLLSYGLGNLIGVIISALIFQYGLGREKLLKPKILLFIYIVFDMILVMALRCLIISIFNPSEFINTFTVSFKEEIIYESMTVVISILILAIASRKDGALLVEMISYIKKVQEDKKLGNLNEIKSQSNFNSNNQITKEDEIDYGNIMDGGIISKEELKELDDMMKAELKEEANKRRGG